MKPALALSYGFPDGAMAKLASHPDASGRITSRDVYALEHLDLDLDDFGALLISMHLDQRFLAGRAAQIESFLRQGGSVIANGHIAYPFLPGMTGVQHHPPDGATVVHALGEPDRPLDFIYPVGKGRVLFHGGNDLWQYGAADSTGRILPQLLRWMFFGERAE